MLLKVCSVCSTRSSPTTLPVFGSKPPWPDRKIHSPTVSPGEYGPGGAGTLSELMRAFMARGLLEGVVAGSIHTDRYTRSQRTRDRIGGRPARTPPCPSQAVP